MNSRFLHLITASTLVALAPSVFGQTAPPPQPPSTEALREIRLASQRLYAYANKSLVRVNVSQSAAGLLEPTLRAEFDAWLKLQPKSDEPRGGGGGGGGAFSGTGGGGRGPNPPRDGRGGRGGGGRDGGPGPGGGFPARGLHGQILRFLDSKIADAKRAGDTALAGQFDAIHLRVEMNRNGFQGELSAILLSNDGYALLPTGLIRVVHADKDGNAINLKAQSTTGGDLPMKFIGTNLLGGYTIIQFAKPTGANPANWTKNRIGAGEFLLSIGANQGTTSYILAASSAVGPNAFIPDHFPASIDDRSGAFVFNTDGDLAAVVAGAPIWNGMGGGGDRQALTASRMQREIKFILDGKKDIEPKKIGFEYRDLDLDSSRALQLSATLGSRRAVIVERIIPDTPAAKAGLKPNDVVISIDDRPINEYRHVQVDLATRSGSVPLGIIRADSDKETTLDLPIDPQK